MEFNGKIRNVIPATTGVSQRGEWKKLTFVFEYKEVETDPYPDSVVLDTFDTNVINGIESCCQKDDQGNLIVKDGQHILTRDIHVRIGFRHKSKFFIPKEGGGQPKFINELRINNIQSIKAAGQQSSQIPAPAPSPQPQAQNPFPQQNQEGGSDDLPF